MILSRHPIFLTSSRYSGLGIPLSTGSMLPVCHQQFVFLRQVIINSLSTCKYSTQHMCECCGVYLHRVVQEGINCIPTLKVTVDYMKNGVNKYVFYTGLPGNRLCNQTCGASPPTRTAACAWSGHRQQGRAGRGEVRTRSEHECHAPVR